MHEVVPREQRTDPTSRADRAAYARRWLFEQLVWEAQLSELRRRAADPSEADGSTESHRAA